MPADYDLRLNLAGILAQISFDQPFYHRKIVNYK